MHLHWYSEIRYNKKQNEINNIALTAKNEDGIMHENAKKDYPLSSLSTIITSLFSTIVTSQVSTSFNRLSNRSNRLFHAEAYTRSNEFDWQRTEIVWRTVDYIWIGIARSMWTHSCAQTIINAFDRRCAQLSDLLLYTLTYHAPLVQFSMILWKDNRTQIWVFLCAIWYVYGRYHSSSLKFRCCWIQFS